jgi:hypothetical protein
MQSAPEFKTSPDVDFQLAKNITWLLCTRIQNLVKLHYMQRSITSQRWQSASASGTWCEQGPADNKLNIGYQAFF